MARGFSFHEIQLRFVLSVLCAGRWRLLLREAAGRRMPPMSSNRRKALRSECRNGAHAHQEPGSKHAVCLCQAGRFGDISESREEGAVRSTGDTQPPALDATTASHLCSPAAVRGGARTALMSFQALTFLQKQNGAPGSPAAFHFICNHPSKLGNTMAFRSDQHGEGRGGGGRRRHPLLRGLRSAAPTEPG